MKVGFIQCTVISAIFAIAGYLLFSSASFNTHIPLTVSGSLLLSGILTPWLASLLNSTPSSSSESSNSVQSVRLMKDRKTGKRKGYGFIEVLTDDIETVINKTNDSIFQERTLKVRPAKDKVEHA